MKILVLIVTILMQCEVFGLNADCLTMNDLVPRAEIGDEISNAEALMLNTTYNDSRVLNFTTCVELGGESDVLTGVQFTLWSEVYREETVLPPIGTMSDSRGFSCRTLTLDGDIQFMRASFDQTL